MIFINGEYQAAERLGNSVNTIFRDYDPFISPDESYLIFGSLRPGEFGTWDFCISFRKEDGGWTYAKDLLENINGGGDS